MPSSTRSAWRPRLAGREVAAAADLRVPAASDRGARTHERMVTPRIADRVAPTA